MLVVVMATAKSPSALDIPDLELPVSAQPAPRPHTSRGAPSAPRVDWLDERQPPNPVSNYADFGDFDDDLMMGNETSGLDVSRSVAPAEEVRQLPTGVTPDASELEIAPEEIARVGGYGDAPTNPFAAVPYAWRVVLRRRTRQAHLKQAHQRLDQAEAERDVALGALARSWQERLRRDGRFQAALETVDGADRRVEEESQALAGTNAQYRERAEELGTRRAELERERTASIEVESQRETVLAAREMEHQRATARLQRWQIVLRNAHQLEERVADPTSELTLSADHVATRDEAKAALPGAQASAEEHERHVKAATNDVKEAREATAVVTHRLRQLDGERRQLDGEFAQESRSRSTLVAEAQSTQRRAWADLARQLLAGDLGKEVSPAEANELLEHDAIVRRLATDAHRQLVALDSYDRAAVRRGFAVSGAAAAFVVALLALLVSLRGGHHADQVDSGDPADPYEVPEEEWE